MKKYKIIVITPAGRRCYLEILKYYVLNDPDIYEWHLWDNCRDDNDRDYINNLDNKYQKIHVISIDSAIGDNRSINKFYGLCKNDSIFYVKMDDDIVYVEQGMVRKLLEVAIESRDKYIWWSPIVINNAICSWALQHYGQLQTNCDLSAQAGCATGWRNSRFAIMLHSAFLDFINIGGKICVPNMSISLSRFSINCIGFFGEDVCRIGNKFCPYGVDDEEWLSAHLPLIMNKYGCIVGSVCVSHYSFFVQENDVNCTDILDRYYSLIGEKRLYDMPGGRNKLIETIKVLIKPIFVKFGIEVKGRRLVREKKFISFLDI